MKRALYIIAVAASCLLVACGKDNKPGKDITASAVAGSWELSEIVTKASIGSVDVSVYLDFTQDGTFTLYQKIGEGRYTKFSGTFTLEKNLLSGNYSDRKPWGPYNVTLEDSRLSLTKTEGTETDTYKKIDAVPSEVTSNLY
ncbi:MAG: lipocalin family protein [Bacteroidales bacterium]|nr:lipocalin family protein [Bacteroidales bacterium]